jgi:hypothetical protein
MLLSCPCTLFLFSIRTGVWVLSTHCYILGCSSRGPRKVWRCDTSAITCATHRHKYRECCRHHRCGRQEKAWQQARALDFLRPDSGRMVKVVVPLAIVCLISLITCTRALNTRTRVIFDANRRRWPWGTVVLDESKQARKQDEQVCRAVRVKEFACRVRCMCSIFCSNTGIFPFAFTVFASLRPFHQRSHELVPHRIQREVCR